MVGPPLTILKTKGLVQKINPLDDVLKEKPAEEEKPAENQKPEEGKEDK